MEIYAKSVRYQYFQAERAYRSLLSNPSKKKYRSNWIKCIKKFKKAYDSDPEDMWAPAALFHYGILYLELSDISFMKEDVQSGIGIMKKLIREHPGSKYKFKALKAIKKNKNKLYSSKYHSSKKVVKKPKTKPEDKIKLIYEKAEADLKKQPKVKKQEASKKATLTNIRFHTYKNRTRIVVDTSSEVKYSFNDLNKDKKNKKPARIYIDFNNSDLGKGLNGNYKINDSQIKSLRIGKFDQNTSRLVMDLSSNTRDFKIFSLFQPYRTVIDVWGKASGSKIKNHPIYGKVNPKPVDIKKAEPGSLIKQLALGVNTIVLDPGHGGKDFGAPGYFKGVHEKYLALTIVKRLASKLRKMGYNVIITRNKDEFISLQERVRMAEAKKADLFISIHMNASRNKKAYGIETYFLNLATDNDSISLAAKENATSEKNISDLQSILDSLMRNAKINESSRLATYIQDGMVSTLSTKYKKIKDRRVRQAPFFVLMGKMPSVLIETSFISNKMECRRLMQKEYQETLCNGIIKGISRYINQTGVRAVYRHPTSQDKG